MRCAIISGGIGLRRYRDEVVTIDNDQTRNIELDFLMNYQGSCVSVKVSLNNIE
jgi:hypothetical protein